MTASTTSRSEINVLGPAGLRTFFRIAEVWRLDESEQRRVLWHPTWTEFQRWQHAESARGHDTLERIGCVIGIFRALNTLFPDAAQADTWLRRPNTAPLFEGGSALDRMMCVSRSDLQTVLSYLNGQIVR